MPVITYNELHRIITESIGFVLTEALLSESQESKSISDAVKLYMRQTGKDYDSVSNFVNGAAIVYRDGKCNYIDGNGRLISDTWFVKVRQFDEDGTAKVIADDGGGAKLRTINRNGEFVGK